MTTLKWIMLPSDALLFCCLLATLILICRSLKKRLVFDAYKQLFKRPMAVCSLVLLTFFLAIAVLDSIHFLKGRADSKGQVIYQSDPVSLFDLVLPPSMTAFEKTYSKPLALTQYVKETNADGKQYYPALKMINQTLHSDSERASFMHQCFWQAVLIGGLFSVALFLLGIFSGIRRQSLFSYSIFSFILVVTISLCALLSQSLHLLGTGKIGQDIFFTSLKSIRTGVFIGVLTTFVMIPFAVILGISSGFFGGLIDDVIQYVYITISSIPGVLLIAASVLSMQVFISNNPNLFGTLADRADMRLISLCVILGLTNWTGLCRMLRAESLKLREMDYIKASKVLGSSRFTIIFKHILPNVMHILLIALVIDFSFLVLAEAVLSYIGVGVSPLTISWGNMINGARLELAREPIVWWPITAAFIFMFTLVLAVNILADNVRDVFDPRASN